jgi:2-desacetyl-2-hydroxyethyl bacteriochlorophyllide A dehydrogenase
MMAPWLLKTLKPVYARTPAGWRPGLRRSYAWTMLRSQATLQRRSIQGAQRIEFLDFEIAHLEPFELLGPTGGEVLVQAHASCVSPGTERAVLCGLPGARRPFPYTPGYSTAGVVVAAGRDARFKPGDRVAGRMPHASLGLMSPGSLFAVPDHVADEEAAFIELGIICLQGVRKAALRPGETLAVIGQGLIGQLAGRLARLAGAQTITAVAASRRRAETALRNGADRFVTPADASDAIDRIGADVVIEAVGSAPAVALAMRAARDGGRVVLLGSSRDLGRGLDWWSMAQARDITVIGAHISGTPQSDASAGLWTYDQEGRLFLDLLARQKLRAADLITWRPRPSECNRVYELLAGGGGEHVAIVFNWTDRPADA